MSIDVISDFIHSVYSYDKGDKIIKMLETGELDFDTWAQDVYDKRQLCEDYILHIFEEDNIKIIELLYRYHDRFDKSYKEDYRQIRPSLNEQGELTPHHTISDRYHFFRCTQMKMLIKYMESTLPLRTRKAKQRKEIPLFYERRFNDEQLELLFNFLIEKGDLALTDFHNFKYFFTGEGETPTKQLKWVSSNKNLTLFINSFFGNDNALWKKAESIFGIKNLAQSYNQLLNSAKYAPKNDYQAFLEKLKNHKYSLFNE